MSVSGPQWFIAGDTAEIGFRRNPGTFFGSIVWFDFRNLGANRNLVAWIELRVNPPAPRRSGSPVPATNQRSGEQSGHRWAADDRSADAEVRVGWPCHRLCHAHRARRGWSLVRHHPVRVLNRSAADVGPTNDSRLMTADPPAGRVAVVGLGRERCSGPFWSNRSGPTVLVQPFWSNRSGPTVLVQPFWSNRSGPTDLVQPIWSNRSGPTDLVRTDEAQRRWRSDAVAGDFGRR